MPMPRPLSLSQQGSALLVSLVILTVITLGAIVAMQRSTLQLRMVGNMQHQQNLFNAAQNDINNMFEQFRNAAEASRILNKVVMAENAASIDPNYHFGQVRINTYGSADNTANLAVLPKYSANIKPFVAGDASTSQNTIRSLSIPTQTEHSLKSNPGSSSGALSPYYFASNVTAVDKRGNTNTQEVGFYFMAPAQVQN